MWVKDYHGKKMNKIYFLIYVFLYFCFIEIANSQTEKILNNFFNDNNDDNTNDENKHKKILKISKKRIKFTPTKGTENISQSFKYEYFNHTDIKNEINKYHSNSISYNERKAKLRSIQKELIDPCYLKGYYSNKTKIKGNGSYIKCFKHINDSLGNKFANMEDLSQNKTSILLGSDFKDIAELISKEKITINDFNYLASDICSANFAEIKKKYFYIAKIDNICFKMTYASVIFKKLFRDNEKILLIFSTNIKDISPEAENEIIMSNYFSFQSESIPSWILVLFVFMVLFFFANYYFKEHIIAFLKKTLYKNELIQLCVEEIYRLIKYRKEENYFNNEGNQRGETYVNNNTKSFTMKPRNLNVSNNIENIIKKEEIEKECKTKIIDLVRQQYKDFKKYHNDSIIQYSSLENEFDIVKTYKDNPTRNNTLAKNESFWNEEGLNHVINLTNNDEKKDILDTLINSLPVKNFLYTFLLRKIKDLCEREIFLSFSEFKIFFYGEVENEIQLKLVILETIEKRNELKSTQVFCLLQIFLAIILSILTNKIFSFITFHNNYINGIIIMFFSFLYITFLIIECLVLITLIDYGKYYYSNILTQPEKLFLEQDFSIDPNHNNELF